MPSPIEQALLDLRTAEQQQDSAAALKVVQESLEKLSDDDRKKLLVMPAVSQLLTDAEQKARDTITPGSTVSDASGRIIAKIPETWEHLWQKAEAEDDFVDWTPMQNRMISVNGVDLQVYAGRRMRTPAAFYDVAKAAWDSETNFLDDVKEIVRRNFGENGIVLHGDGTKA